ncbi:MAG: hypothetical protein K2X47_01150 [Bdellovibrionales bacterium]|nr:hypothetical protein [Bdellovibrionales bacterium]
MGLLSKLNAMSLDTRMVEWQLRQGQLTKEDLQKHMDKLPDLASMAEQIQIDDSDMDSHDDDDMDLNGSGENAH